MSKTFGQRLKELRGNESQASWAEHLKLKPGTLGNYERNRNQPKFQTIEAICEKCQVNVEWLLFGTGPQYKNHPAKKLSSDQEEGSITLESSSPLDSDLEKNLKTLPGNYKNHPAKALPSTKTEGRLALEDSSTSTLKAKSGKRLRQQDLLVKLSRLEDDNHKLKERLKELEKKLT
ncbi:MAG: helix-turn-helix transcriptional regulator [Desulfovibrionaceae bacterium]|nr:helix-turn-helix transcriptional regulator [Desulfovibrionaceae bacterium]